MTRKPPRRGYPVATLVGIKQSQATVWNLYTNIARLETTINAQGSRTDAKILYNFHESLIDAIRPSIKQGIRSVVIAASPKTSYIQEFLKHVKDHHTWLIQGSNKVAFVEISGAANTKSEVTELTKSPRLREIIEEANKLENENLIDLLEKRLSKETRQPLVLYSIEDIENAVYTLGEKGKPEPESLIITTQYLDSRQKGRINRLIQIAANKKIKTRIVNAHTPQGKRIQQLGGIICILTPE